MRMPRLPALALIPILALTACNTASGPAEFSESQQDVIDGRLRLVTNTAAGLVYLDPDADLGRFDQILLDPLDLSSVEIRQANTTAGALKRTTWVLDDTSRDMLQTAYMEVFSRDLAKTGDYEIVSEPGPRALRVHATVTAVEPIGNRDNNQTRDLTNSRWYREGIRTMAIAFALSDSENGEVFAIVKDVHSGSAQKGMHRIMRTWDETRPLFGEDSNMTDMRRLFSRWARMLRARLDIAQGY